MSILLSIVAVVAPLLVQTPANLDGLHAPAGTWHVAGGSAAHNGSSLTDLAKLDPQLRWQHTTKGELTGEALVWGRRVFITQKLNDNQRSLQIIDLITGKRTSEKTFKTTEPLTPSVWGDVVGLRNAPGKISFYRVKGSKKNRYTRIGGVECEAGVGQPLVYGSEAYVPTAEGLIRVDPAGGRVVWSTPGHFVGAVSLMGKYVYGLVYVDQSAQLVAIERTTGKPVGSVGVGHHNGAIPPAEAPAYIALSPDDAKVRHAYRVPSTKKETFNQVVVSLKNSKPKQMSALLNRDYAAAYCEKGWLEFQQPTDLVLGLFDPIKSSSKRQLGRELANRVLHPKTASQPVALSHAGSTLLIGGMAVDQVELRVLWLVKGMTIGRAIPATDCVLFRTQSNQISAFGSPAPPAKTLAYLPRDLEPTDDGDFELGKVEGLDSSGASFDGKYVLAGSKDAVFVDRRRKSTEVEFDDLVYVEDASARPLIMAGVQGMVLGITRLFEQTLQAAYLDLAYDARKTKDVEQLRRLFSEAMRRGAEGKRVQDIEKVLAGYAKSPPKRPVSKRVADIEAREAKLKTRNMGSALYERITALGDEPEPLDRLAMLRAVLHADAHFPAAVDEVVAMVEVHFKTMGVSRTSTFGKALALTASKGASDPKAPLPMDWLEFLDVAERMNLAYITVVPDGPGLTVDQRTLGLATNRWRKDIFMLRSPRMQVISAIANPGQIARCVRLGEVVSDMLDKEFAPYGNVERGDQAMTLYLYEDQAEYMAKSMGLSGAMRPDQTWQAGHYSPGENMQHIFLPDTADAFENVMQTFVHELTHNWMDRRCPLYDQADINRSPATAGFWLVEGIASFFEEFKIDVRTGEYSSVNPRVTSFDILANAKTIHDWKDMLSMSQSRFGRIDTQSAIACQRAWYLGGYSGLTAKSLFYQQASSTARYLYLADNGAHRAKLFAMVKAYYTGDVANTDIAAAVGMQPDDLGAAIKKFAIESLQAGH